MKKNLLIALVASIGLIACVVKQFPQTGSSIGSSQLQEMMTKGKVNLIDVRTDGEYKLGHIVGASQIDVLQEASFLQQLQQLDPKQPYVVYCQSGRRSKTAMRLMQEKGFKKVVDLDGGFLGWKGATEK